MSDQLFDVVIYEKSTRCIACVIGQSMRSWDGSGSDRNTAELRVQSGRERINYRYECEMVPAGKFKEGDKLP